jgi:hypothetical protein
LTSWGPKGASASALLRDAARLLTGVGVLERPDVAAPACCRAALEILTQLSGTETEGLEAARTGLETAVVDFLTVRDTSADSAVSTSVPPGDGLAADFAHTADEKPRGRREALARTPYPEPLLQRPRRWPSPRSLLNSARVVTR